MNRKKSVMTEKQRIEAIICGNKPDRVPIWPFAPTAFSCVHTETSISDAYNRPDISLKAQRETAQEFGWVFVPMLGYASYGAWEFGGAIKWPSDEYSQAPSISAHPVEKPGDVFKLKCPEVSTAGIIPLQREFYELASMERLDNEPFFARVALIDPFTIASNIAGPERFSKWLIREQDAAHHLVKLATEHIKDLAEYWANILGTKEVLAAAATITTTNQMISPKHTEEFDFPYLKEAMEAALAVGYKHIYIHMCGEQNRNLPLWSKIPFGDPGFISVGHEIELSKAAEFFPGHVIVGNLNPTIIQTGTPEQIYRDARKNIEFGKTIPGGYIFSPGCELPPMATTDQVMALTDAINDFGWYDD